MVEAATAMVSVEVHIVRIQITLGMIRRINLQVAIRSNEGETDSGGASSKIFLHAYAGTPCVVFIPGLIPESITALPTTADMSR